MSDNGEFNQDDNDGQQNGGTLRQKLEQALAALKAKDQELEALRSKETERTVKATWDELQVPAPIREFYKGDQTPDAMKQWWEASKGFFNVQAVEEKPAEQQELTPEQLAAQAAAEAFADASSIGRDAPAGAVNAIDAKVQAAKKLKGADFEAAQREIFKELGFDEY